MSLGVEMLLPSDCLNINEFRAIHMNTHSNAHGYSLEQSYCLKGYVHLGAILALSGAKN